MTNNHVLDSVEIAQSSYAEFEYELDENNKPKSSILFGFEPQKLYITDEKLDFTLVYVKQISESGGKNIADYGFVPIIETVGKVKEGDAVSIIQHPKGERKSVALRNNTVTQLDEDFIQYQTDTEPGSSGSPVFNDAWELVALHHSGVPMTDAQGKILTKKGTVATSNDDENDIAWKANEGVRISRIVAYLRQKATSTQKIFLKDIIGNLPEPVDNPNTGDANNDKNINADKYYKGIDLTGNNLLKHSAIY
ncbi:MHCK/EF2 kise domain containing protein [Daphnia sinensis]|uniref:Serine protease n=1 Tax=Daphnia sinensis TaxID=1820382 RepID=A0AAD5KEZ4_9CRUS|nr:MHCK/EF2 kise domain containing protein [Daphnia sinensis]